MSMKINRLGIDIDGTITRPDSFIPYLNKSFNKNLTIEDITQYDLLPLLNISTERFWKWMDENEPIIYANSPLVDQAKEIIHYWQDDFKLLYISARRQHLQDITKDWFIKNNIPYDEINLVGNHNKIEAVKNKKIDLFLEDKHDNACSIAEECHIPVILFDTPYNQDPIPKNVIRVKNWLEANKRIQELLY